MILNGVSHYKHWVQTAIVITTSAAWRQRSIAAECQRTEPELRFSGPYHQYLYVRRRFSYLLVLYVKIAVHHIGEIFFPPLQEI